MKQLDIFGKEIDVAELQEKEKKCIKSSIKSRFRQFHGYDKANRCKNCIHHKCIHDYGKRFHKCTKIGITNSEATDIRLKDFACNLFKKGDDVNNDR